MDSRMNRLGFLAVDKNTYQLPSSYAGHDAKVYTCVKAKLHHHGGMVDILATSDIVRTNTA